MSENGMSPGARRGTALMATLIFAALIATVVLYMHANTLNAARISSLRENSDAALAAADFAVETAVTNLSDMQLRPIDPSAPPGVPSELIVDKDWVRREPFFAAGSDQRRIGGTLDVNGRNMDYRVLVRSLRDARENNTMPESWLKGVNDDVEGEGFVFGDESKGRLRRYVGTYEITAAVKPSSAAGIEPMRSPRAGRAAPAVSADPALAVTASSKTLVTLRYQHPLNDQETLAVLNSDNLSLLNATPELNVSGEDHYGIKSVVQNVIQEIVIEDIVSIKGTDSQLFSVTNDSWSAGEQTLQFQMDSTGRAYNPHVPRTVDFSKSNIDREMISRDENAQHDKYVFGGKRESGENVSLSNGPASASTNYKYGRSVSFAPEDTRQSLILETTFAQGRPTAQSQVAFAIGKFENFSRLYLNYTLPVAKRMLANPPAVPSHPADKDSSEKVQTWRDGWEPAPLTYWSKAKTKAGQRRTQIPLDNSSSPARRHMATRFWIKNQKGEFLVRDYAYTKSPPGNEVPVPDDNWDGYYTWSRYYGYGTSDASGDGKYHMGYPYDKDNAGSGNYKAIHTRLLTLEELLGFLVTKGDDGLPARLDERGNIVGGTPEFILDPDTGAKIPYRLTVNGNTTQFDEAAQRANSSDNYGIKTGNIDDPRYPPRDGIYVVERDNKGNRILDPKTGKPKVTVYRTMEDFAYELNIAPAGEEEDLRSMATIHMVVEQTPETHPSSGTKPQNMYFDMGVCISVVFPKIIEEELKVNIFEGMDKYWWEGLAQETLTDRMSHNAITAAPTEEVLEAETPEEKLAALYGYGFGRLAEGDAAGVFTMVDDDGEKIAFRKAVLDTVEESPEIGRLLNKDKDAPGAFYYATRDDLYRVLAGLVEQNLMSNETLNNAPDLVDLSLNYVRALPVNSGAKFRLVSERYYTDTGYRKAPLANGHPSALTVSDKYVSSRTFAGDVFGMLTQSADGVLMLRENGGNPSRATNFDIGLEGRDLSVPVPVKLPFLPGERLIEPSDRNYNIDGGMFVPVINKNHNTLQYNGQPLEPVIITQEQFNNADGRNYLHTTPSWVDKHALLMGYGTREEISRSAIGWHRSGPKFAEPLMQDHYVYAIAGKPGFMPYVLDSSTGRVALIRDEESGMSTDEIRELPFRPLLKKPEEMPTFVIEGAPLDGAGILVVNGNLVISTEFAYHGTLVVMGDLIMKPVMMELPKRNENGLIIDKDGNVLLNDYKGYYYTENRARVPSEPDTINVPTSSLVMQGQFFLGGAVKNDLALNGRKGKIDIRGSSGALEDTTGSMFDGKERRGLFRLLHSGVDSQKEIDELWE